ncbi:hypothetical protein ACFPOB_20545 [Bosea eneae]|uniref:Uncharacterized protein n=1 Tax=Bosea eneae TaxID=151454 RepID=A0ABW0IXH2_9HYPH
MTPAAAIAMIDRQLAAHGQTVTLQRMEGETVAQTATVPAFVRGFEPRELVNGITQDDAKVILSPTGLAGWDSGGEDPIVPTADNDMVIAGRVRRIIAAVGIRMADQVVRIECAVR